MSTIYNPVNLQVNISSLLGQITLNRTEAGLTTSIRNLSSGIRIHSGRDDPVGFVSSTMMRTDITSMSQAVSNCQKASSLISSTDSTLSHLNSMLVDLRGLVTEAANTGGENAATLAALQLEADSILNTIDYIANSTKFQGRKLLDGSLDFTTYGVDSSKISNLDISQANFLGRTEKDVAIQVLEAPRQAELYYPLGALKNSVVLDVGGTGGYQTFSFDKDATVNDIADAVNRLSDATGVAATIYSKSTPGNVGLTSYGKNNDIILTASEPGTAAGNFIVRYTAPSEGNEAAYLDVTEGSGNEPTVINVVLQTGLWQKAEYHYNGNDDGIANNEFTISAKQSGAEFNDIQFTFNNVYGTGEDTGIAVDLKAVPKTFQINVSYNENDPTDPANSTVEDLAAWIAESPVASTYFELSNTPPSDGSGPLVPTSSFDLSNEGVDGGSVVSTAEQVATLINTSPLLKNIDGSGRVSATIPTGSTGTGTVTPFSEVSYYGDPSESNYLQFLAPENSPSIKFVSKPGTPLSIDDTTYPPTYGHASAVVQGFEAGTSFTLKALGTGPDYDGVGVIFRDASEESAVFDAQRNAVVFSVDFSGRASDPDRDAFTMDDLQALVSLDPFVSSRFSVAPLSPYNGGDPPKFDSPEYLGINARVGETSGGLVSEGAIVVHLETDANGIVKTTANDLVKFFNDPSTEESKAVLDRLGISVSNIDPENTNMTVCTTGQSNNGTGVLKPTYDPADVNCDGTDGTYPDVVFSSYGTDIRQDYPTATVSSQNGVDASFTITARQAGTTYNNTTVRVVSDAAGPTVQFNSLTKEIRIGVSTQNPSTADDIIALINDTPGLSGLFVASRGPSSDGTGTVAVGDHATLTGGVKEADNRPEGTVVATNGINAMFQVEAKKADARYDDTQVVIVTDVNGPKVTYDAQSKQLTVGIDPNNPPTARQVVDLINSTGDVKDLFEASIPAIAEGTSLVPTGEDAVHVGDSGTLKARSTGMSLGAAMLGNSDQASLGLTFHSIEYGSQEFVSVVASLGTEFPLTDRYGNVMEKTYGTDVIATINGQLATGNGRIASTSTSDLDMSVWLDPSVERGDVFGFRITGGGALIQLGPDAVSSQQARIAIKNTHSIALGGVNGYLSQIRSGGPYDLLTDTTTAYKIIQEVSTEISSLRSRLGSFQKNQIEMNMENLIDAIEIETEAMSDIKDTDFAAETSEMLRQQLLMQSNISVLQQAGQSAQMLLGLLQR